MTGSSALNVTFVVPDLASGGAERHLATLLERLDASRFEARVICLGREGELFAEVASTVPAHALHHSKRQVLRSVWTLARELRRTRPDVVVLRGYSAELVGRVAALLAGRPRCVVWVHNCEDFEPRGRVRRVSDRVLERATTAYFGVADRQVPYLTQTLGHPSDKVHVIHNGVEVDKFAAPDKASSSRIRGELGLDVDDVVIGILAGLRPEKDHELFLAAARDVLDRASDARFLVIGDGALRAGLEMRARELQLGDRVQFAGFRPDVARVLQAVDIVALTSYSECFPISLLEAMAASRPTVCTDVGGVAEIVEHGRTGLLVPARDQGALTRALLELVEEPARRVTMGQAGRKRVEQRFTLDHSVREAETRLADVAHSRSNHPIGLTMIMDETGVGGVELVTWRMFEAMDRDLVVPRLVCLRKGGSLVEDFRAVGVEVDVLHRTGKLDVRTLPRLVRALRSSGTEVVLLAHHHRASLVLGRIAALLAGARVVLLAAHGMDLVPRGQRVLPVHTVQTLRGVTALVLLAPSQGRYLHQYEGVGARRRSSTREAVIPNGIPLTPPPVPGDRARARAELGLPDDLFVVGIVARLAAEKAHEVLFVAFEGLLQTHPDALLVIIGGGPRDAELRTLATDLGIDDRALFTGLRRNAAELVPAFDVFVLSSMHEAAPIGVIEAMMAGVPLVATDVGALRDLVHDRQEGILVPVDDSASMTEALVELASDDDLRSQLGVAARIRAERDFTVERMARAYECLVQELVVRR